jgi:hypothetical protein
MSAVDPPAGWTVWSDEPHRIVLAFRPDVFDGDAWPAPCLPTLYLTDRSERRPGSPAMDDWRVVLRLEPDVDVIERRGLADREAAVEEAEGLAAGFAAGEFDLAGAYQRPRDAYLSRLAELTGEASTG